MKRARIRHYVLVGLVLLAAVSMRPLEDQLAPGHVEEGAEDDERDQR